MAEFGLLHFDTISQFFVEFKSPLAHFKLTDFSFRESVFIMSKNKNMTSQSKRKEKIKWLYA